MIKETMKNEMELRIAELEEMAKNTKKSCSVLTSGRYAIKVANDLTYVFGGQTLSGAAPQVKRFISHYSDDLVTISYSLEGIPTFDKAAIEKSNLTPLIDKDIPKYFEITDTIIYYSNGKDGNSKSEHEEYKHEESMYYQTKKTMEMLKKQGLL